MSVYVCMGEHGKGMECADGIYIQIKEAGKVKRHKHTKKSTIMVFSRFTQKQKQRKGRSDIKIEKNDLQLNQGP